MISSMHLKQRDILMPALILPKPPDEVNSKVNKRNRIAHTKYEVQDSEREDIITNLSDAAFMLYQYYLRCASIDDIPMEDRNAQAYFKWSTSKVARARKQLEKAGYFKKIIYTATSGKRTITYYISKDRVAQI